MNIAKQARYFLINTLVPIPTKRKSSSMSLFFKAIQPPDMEPDSDSDDELDEAENDDIDDYEWEDYNIVTFVPEVPNISIRNSRSSSSNDDEPSTDDWLPKFNGCRSKK